jgi:hypothetical protein
MKNINTSMLALNNQPSRFDKILTQNMHHTPVRILAFLGMLFALGFNTVLGQNIHKFVSPNYRDQEVGGISLAQLSTQEGEIPIAVTCEDDRITVFWWDIQSSNWQSWERFHDDISIRNRTFSMGQLMDLDWSESVGLDVGNGLIYLVYKRIPEDQSGQFIGQKPDEPQLYMDILEWDQENSTVRPQNDSGNPLLLPIEALGYTDVGFYLWTGWDSRFNKLVILFQASKPVRIDDEPERVSYPGIEEKGGSIANEEPAEIGIVIPKGKLNLVMIACDGNPDGISTGTYWNDLIIDEGGYDFDILQSDVTGIHMVYRRDAYSMIIKEIPAIEDYEFLINEEVENENIEFNPLFYRACYFDPDENNSLKINTSASIDLIPGGDHPQFQLINPLMITVDRPKSGKITMDYIRMDDRKFDWKPYHEFDRSAKLMLQHKPGANNQWKNYELFTFDPLILTRGNYLHNILPSVMNFKNGIVYYSSTLEPRPIYRIGSWETVETAVGEESKQALRFTFLMQILNGDELGELKSRGFLGLIEFELDGSITKVENWSTVDHSHLQISLADWPGEGQSSVSSCENFQFDPLEYDPLEYYWHGTESELANTIGSNLSVEDKLSPLRFYAYCDAGDGGLRIIFNENDNVPAELVAVGKEDGVIQSEEVGGTGLYGIEEFKIPASEWVECTIDSYMVFYHADDTKYYCTDFNNNIIEPTSLFSGIHPILDGLFLYASATNLGALSGDNILLLNQTVEDDLVVHVRDSLWELHDIFNQNPDYRIRDAELSFDKCRLTFRPKGENSEIVVERLGAWNTFFKSNNNTVDYKQRFNFTSDDIRVVQSWMRKMLAVNKIIIEIDYLRSYTIGVLMRDLRSVDLETGNLISRPHPNWINNDAFSYRNDSERRIASALCAKPVEDSSLEISKIKADVSILIIGKAVSMIIAILLALAVYFGLAFITNLVFEQTVAAAVGIAVPLLVGAIIGALLGLGIEPGLVGLILGLVIGTLGGLSVSVGSVVGGGLGAGISCAGFIVIASFIAEPMIEDRIEEEMKRELTTAGPDGLKANLDNSQLMWFGGEALAESIAQKILEQMNIERNSCGWNRYRDQFWHMALVEPGEITVWVNTQQIPSDL